MSSPFYVLLAPVLTDGHIHSPPPIPIHVLVSILKLSNLYNIHSGRAFAVAHIFKHSETNSALLLKLGCDERVWEWIRPALTHLVTKHDNAFSQQEFDLLGPSLLFQVKSIRSRMLRERQQLVVVPPSAINHHSCANPELCRVQWRVYWFDTAIPVLFKEAFMPPQVFLVVMLEMYQSSPCVACFNTTLRYLEHDVIGREQMVLREAITKFCTSLPFFPGEPSDG